MSLYLFGVVTGIIFGIFISLALDDGDDDVL